MGTVEKIVDTLNKMCMDKKSQATHRYEEHSSWLSNEFTNLRNLIQVQNTCSTNRDSSESRQKRKSPETSSNGSRNSPQAKRNSTDFADIAAEEGLPTDLNRLKKQELLDALESRGNCSMTMTALKKDLVDALKDLLLDLHSRRKEDPVHVQPQEEDEEVEIVPEAEDHVEEPDSAEEVERGKEEEEVDQASMTEAADSVQPSVVTAEQPRRLSDTRMSQEGAVGKSSSPRKMSILAEARQQVNVARKSVLQEQSENSVDRSSRLAKEYEARKMRHRSSQIRLSQAMGNSEEIEGSRSRLESADTTTSACDEEVEIAMESDEVVPEQVMTSAEDPVEAEEDGVWNEVPSPHHDVPEKVNEVAAPVVTVAAKSSPHYEPKTLFTNLPPSQHASNKPSTAPPRSKSPPLSEKSKTLPVPASPAMVDKTAISSAHAKEADDADKVESTAPPPVQKTASSSSVSSVTSSTSENKPASFSKKISNLIGGSQTSFLGASGSGASSSFLNKEKEKEKPKVAALAQAAKLKEREEARAAQKKKELEEKKNAYKLKMQQSSAASSQAASSSKLFPSKLASSKPSAHSTHSAVSQPSASSSTQPAQKKNGFGWFGSKKEAGAPVAASSTAVPTPTEAAAPTGHKHLSAAQLAEKSAAEKAQSAVTSTASPDDRENLKPSQMAHAAAPAVAPSSTSASSQKVLGEKAINPSDYKTAAPATPGKGGVEEEYEPSPPREEYPIKQTDESSDEDENDSGTDDDEADKAQIPEWARGSKLREALERQYGINGHTAVDPDLIFLDVQTCNLEEIFGRREGKCGKYSVRTSSAKWDADKISLVEKRDYRAQMGFEGL